MPGSHLPLISFLIWQSYLICISLRAVGIQKFSRTIHRRCFFYGGGAPATPVPVLFRITIPRIWRNQAKFYTDFWQVYREVIPLKQHERVSKGSGKTSYIERFNNTLRQRIGHLARKTLFFSKTLKNHIGIIFNFIHHYNEVLLG